VGDIHKTTWFIKKPNGFGSRIFTGVV